MLLAAIVAMLLQGSAPAKAPSIITNPDWLRRPSADHMAEFYPSRARMRGLAGRATVSCSVLADGTLAACQVISEDPVGEGFGEAAVKMAQVFRMRPMTKDGLPVEGGTVRIPLRFILPGGDLPPMETIADCYGVMARRAEADPTSTEAWRGLLYWQVQLTSYMANQGLRPSQVVEELRQGQIRVADSQAMVNLKRLAAFCEERTPPPAPAAPPAVKPG